jgi:hypothetical protein
MHVDIEFLLMGILFVFYGTLAGFYPPAHAYIQKISLDKRWLPPYLAKYSVHYVDGACMLGLGASLILIAFTQ